MDSVVHAELPIVESADTVWTRKKFGGPERLKKCCIHRKCKGQEPQNNQSSTVKLMVDKLRKS